MGVDVADELHRLGRLRVFRVRRLVVPCERDFPAVCAGDDGAKLVGAQNGDARLLQPGEGLLVGVTVGVALAHGDHGVVGAYLVEKAVARGGVGAVMPHLQHVRFPRHPAAPVVQHVVFRAGLHVPGEQERGVAVLHPQNDGGVIGVGVGLHGAEDCDGGFSQRPAVAGGGNGDLQPLLVGVIDEIVEHLGSIGSCGGIHGVGGIHRQNRGQTAHMVFVGVGADHGGQLLHALLL